MKITFVLPHAGISGGVRVVAIYAEELQRRGHDVFVISQPTRLPSLRDNLRQLVKAGRWGYPKGPKPSHFDHRSVTHRVLKQCRPVTDEDVPDADVVIATWWETAEWVSRLSPSKGAKAYFIQHHETLFDGQPADRVAATWRLPLHKITISRWLLDLARDQYGDSDVSLVPNSVDTAQFNAPPRSKQARPTVGMIYSTVPFKGCDISLRAATLSRTQVPDLQMVIFGVYEVVPSLPLPDGALYTRQPAQDRIKDLYAQCDAWLCGSRSEGFGLPVLEAMACRCPAVSTRVGGPVDFIQDGVNGFLVDIDDTEALADRLVRVLKMNPPQWQAMSDAAYATATRYSWDDATDLFEKALETAIQRSGFVEKGV